MEMKLLVQVQECSTPPTLYQTLSQCYDIMTRLNKRYNGKQGKQQEKEKLLATAAASGS